MRQAWGLVALAACGRVDFDPASCTNPLPTLLLGEVSTIGTAADGRYYGMGANAGNELLLAGSNYAVPQPLPDLDGLTQLALGLYFGIGVEPGGTMLYWGEGEGGIRQAGTATDWHDIQAAWAWGCAMHSDATLWCWGDNYLGNLGDGTMSDSSVPIEVAIPPVASYAIGNYVACAIDTGGALWCWGQNDHGQTGNGACCDPIVTPTRIGTDTDWTQVAVGGPGVCARKADLTLWCWGQGYFNGTIGDLYQPARVGTRSDWIDVHVGFYVACALAQDRSLWCFGQNDHGELGRGPGAPMFDTTPMQVPLPGPVDTVQLGGAQACAGVDAQLWCWGRNDEGMLGTGTFEDASSPFARCSM